MSLHGYSSRRWRAAVHEAGHVLMAVEEGCPFGDVELNRTADANGAMNRIGCRRGDDEAVRIALGGIVAVRLCRSRVSVRWSAGLIGRARDRPASETRGHAHETFACC
jgi:hypothetical protein